MMNDQYQILPDLTEAEYAGLKASIAEHGVWELIVFDEQDNVLDGHHRLRACAELGITDYPTIIRPGLSEEEKVEHIVSLNLDRRHLTVQQRRELVANLRQRGWSLPRISEKLKIGLGTAHRDVAAFPNGNPQTVTGNDGKRYPAVIAKNRHEHTRALEGLAVLGPDDLPTKMHTAQHIAGLAQQQEISQRPPAPALPEGTYTVILADPPWQLSGAGFGETATRHYATMPTDEICALPVSDLAADDCLLFLWARYPMLPEALRVIEAWGFEYSTVAFTWAKTTQSGAWHYGLGGWTRANPEIVLLGRRGSVQRIDRGVANLVVADVSKHSEKPGEVRDRIVRLVGDVPRIELFARESANGWASWGNELDPPRISLWQTAS